MSAETRDLLATVIIIGVVSLCLLVGAVRC
jgi:hypothetical protein